MVALPPPKPPAPVVQLIPTAALDLIISFEIGSPATYQKRYQAPIWPGAASGVTVGIGYDLGHQHAAVIEQDWVVVPAYVQRLADQAGITGTAAQAQLVGLADIRIDYGTARGVFDATSVVQYYRLMRGVFPGAERLHANAQGALTSLVYNRGGSMRGESRREMRTIRDVCLVHSDHACIARELRAMSRIWVGSTIEKGMKRRREAEAALVERAP